ncbi:MAG TPA: hypothetical protein VGI11_19130 [Variovorax sp.]|jgi:hypothetical protein
MQASYKVLALSACAALAVFGSVSASAQNDGNDFHPLVRTTGALPDVDAGAVAAAHPANGEPVGSSTSMPATSSSITREQVYKEAVEAAHPAAGEPVGSSTMAPLPKGSGSGE